MSAEKHGKTQKTKKTRLLNFFSAVLFWFLLWTVISKTVSLELLVPSPLSVFNALKELCTTREYYISCAKTLARVLTGWLAGLAVGTLTAVLTYASGAAKIVLSPLLHIVRATPVASFIVLALVLMRSANVPIFTGMLIAIPVVWGNITEGLLSPDDKLIEMANAFEMKRTIRIREIYIPAAKPYFSAAATTSMGLVWKAGVAAEVICTPTASIGAGIQNAKVYLETPSLFAWTLTVVVLSMLLEKTVGLMFEKKGRNAAHKI